MIDAVKEVMELIRHLPDIALWILAGLLFYKVTVIGSIYGVIRLAINKTHDYLTAPSAAQTKQTLFTDIATMMDEKNVPRMEALLKRLTSVSPFTGKPSEVSYYNCIFIHKSHMDLLEAALNREIERIQAETAERDKRMAEFKAKYPAVGG